MRWILVLLSVLFFAVVLSASKLGLKKTVSTTDSFPIEIPVEVTVYPEVSEEVEEDTEELELVDVTVDVEEEKLIITIIERSRYTTTYDKLFKRYTTLYLSGYDWRWLKAICITESALNPTAVSPVGASGLCQFMPGTWAEVSKQIGVKPDAVFDPESNVLAAAYYMDRMLYTWRAPRPTLDRKSLANASYNAGPGSLIRAQTLCNGKMLYEEIIPCLPDVTGRHHVETINYVERIRKVENQLLYE